MSNWCRATFDILLFSCLQLTAVIYWDIFSPVNASLSAKSLFWEGLCSCAVSTGSDKGTEIYVESNDKRSKLDNLLDA